MRIACNTGQMLSGDESSYERFVELGEVLDERNIDLYKKLEAAGWRASVRMKQGFRYMCPCDSQHNRWVDTAPIVPPRLTYLFTNTCFTADRKVL